MIASSTRGASATRGERDHGQATVEFALALPFVLVVLLGLVQVVSVMRDHLAVGLAAREAARAASVADDPQGAASRAAAEAVDLEPLLVHTSTHEGRVTVVVRYVNPTAIPMIGRLIGDVEVQASATMTQEPP